MASSFADRIIGAARLDVATFEEVEADESATVQALIVVAAGAASAGIGAIFGGFYVFFLAILGQVMGWVLLAVAIFLVGGLVFPEPQTKADAGQVLRTVGFAWSPALLSLLTAIPLLGLIFSVIISLWCLAGTVVAVRQALDYESTGRAVGVSALGWLLYMVFAKLPFLMLGAFARAIS